MNRRQFSFAAACLSTAVLGCDSDPKPAQTATLINNDQIQHAIELLSASINNLEDEIGDFDSVDWRRVVPEVRYTASVVVADLARLRAALGYSE